MKISEIEVGMGFILDIVNSRSIYNCKRLPSDDTYFYFSFLPLNSNPNERVMLTKNANYLIVEAQSYINNDKWIITQKNVVLFPDDLFIMDEL